MKNTVPLTLGDLIYSQEYGLPAKICGGCYLRIHVSLRLEGVASWRILGSQNNTHKGTYAS